ncbi:MAG: metal-dependent hydrolase [Bdellovibrionales bacterium]|nr:metal-dependent hydrolase [Bdellovibrionales bacterium]
MDNLTHSIIGAAVARILPERFRRPEIYWASVIANNLPDADVVVRFFPGATTFDYLIQHRGYSHTFLAAPVLGLASAAIAKRATRAPRWTLELALIGILGSLLHVGADFLNNYGVHPLTPFENRWFYGDSVYIVEPLLWFALVPLLVREAGRAWSRIAWAMLGLSMLALVWLFPMFTNGLAWALTAFFALSAVLAAKFRGPALGRIVPVAFFVAAIGAFVAAGVRARAVAETDWRENAGSEKLLDLASNPAPGNPACWGVWIAARTPTEFRFYALDISLFPDAFPVDGCATGSPVTHTAIYEKASYRPSSAIRWNGLVRIPVAEFERYREKSPLFRRLLSYSRFPFIREYPDGHAIAGDLRYDREEGVGFTEVEIPATGEATPTDESRNSPWDPPFHSDE